jgi:hypothetical protein
MVRDDHVRQLRDGDVTTGSMGPTAEGTVVLERDNLGVACRKVGLSSEGPA